ncbi:MAG: sulfotransferase family protein [Proteobacteria bacterium]|nr:sulfotransferase family protein [Pseudomonadota bacterium]
MTRILALWAVPRSTSTAFEWMMRQRGDFLCRHEPFGEAWYFGEDRRVPRPNATPPRPGLSFAAVWRNLREEAGKGPVFVKDFPHYIMHMADDSFLDRFIHSFLIRDPARMLPSMYDKWPDFLIEETGYAEQRILFDRLCERDGQAPPLIDADDLQNRPEATVRAYCAAVGIPFLAEALRWESGERNAVSWYDGGSWHDNLRTSTGLAPQRTNYLSVDANDHLQQAYAECLPYYEAMRQHRLRID